MARSQFAYPLATLESLARDALALAKNAGASACELHVSEGHGQTVTVRKGEVETIEYNTDKDFGISVYIGQQTGYASSSDFSPKALQDTVKAALTIARFTAADEANGLADAKLIAKKIGDLDLFHPWDLPVERAIEMARECEAAAFALDKRIANSEGATVSTQQSQYVAANSAGFFGAMKSSRHYLACSVIAVEGDDMQRDDWYSAARAPNDLASPRAIGDYAGRRALARLRARRLPTCKVPVLFEAPMANGLLGSFTSAVSGGSLYRKASFLLDSAGQQVFSPIVTLREEPHQPRGLASSYFDDDGVATRARTVVDAGVLQGYFLSVYSARKLGLKTTGNAGGAHNLILTPGRDDLEALLRRMGRGLFVTDLMGQGVNMVTGDYSRGASGYWVEDGAIQYPVEEITIAGNLKDIFKNVVAIGADTLTRGSRTCGSILIGEMTIAGT